MDDISREKEKGFDFEYLGDVPKAKEEVGDTYQTPGFGLASQLFSSVAKFVIEKLGEKEGEALLKEAIEYFGRERGRRIAERVKKLGKPLTFKNWLIYSDIDSSRNFEPIPEIKDGDLVANVKNCTFHNGANEWGLEDYANIYCKYVDYAILYGYNPDIKLILKERGATGEDFCVFRYIMKEGNK
jgi:hypothetical protein